MTVARPACPVSRSYVAALALLDPTGVVMVLAEVFGRSWLQARASGEALGGSLLASVMLRKHDLAPCAV
jgi:hypothetical protein